MKYRSTRGNGGVIESAQAIISGISPDGGLYIPESIPKLSTDELSGLKSSTYEQTALTVLSKFLTDFSRREIENIVGKSYVSFESSEVVPLKRLRGSDYLLELWHGPTSAFKDVALQMLPHLMTASAVKVGLNKKIHILVATSGDTGKAALEGFRDVPGTRISVFYPADGVSSMQKLQMMTQEGANVFVSGIHGNFDDAQNGVKRIFCDADTAARLAARGEILSSANSINWGRLVPQIVYYVNAYGQLMRSGESFDGFNVVVPTGNFGNILAAYFAKKMGVPITKLICASNRNNVLTDFFNSGTYDKNREFFPTVSPSMDILISSNLERLIYLLAGEDGDAVKSFMSRLARDGRYAITAAMKSQTDRDFYASYATDEETAATIKRVFEETGYLSDTHTAVGIKVCEDYRNGSGDGRPTVIASTASPYKFPRAVLGAIDEQLLCGDDFELLSRLEEKSGVPVPAGIAGLKNKAVRFTGVCDSGGMTAAVLG